MAVSRGLQRILGRQTPERVPEVSPEPARVDYEARRAFFAGQKAGRYWWHRQVGDSYLPDVYGNLTDEEFGLLSDWFRDTDEKKLIGECSVPLISWICSLISANNISRVVQLGTYAGYSALLIGWTLRRMGKRQGLLAVDIDPRVTDYTSGWLTRAGLDEYVSQHLGDSADPTLPSLAAGHFGSPPQLVFIDSSHQYQHTLRELALWYPSLPEGSMILMHDTSKFASSFDPTKEGGVNRAVGEWTPGPDGAVLNLWFKEPVASGPARSYMDGCGVGIIVKTGIAG